MASPVSQRCFEDFAVGDRFASPSLRNQRGETVLEGQHRYLIAYRPAA